MLSFGHGAVMLSIGKGGERIICNFCSFFVHFELWGYEALPNLKWRP